MIHRIIRSTRRTRVLSLVAALLFAGASSGLAAEVGLEQAFEPAGAAVAPNISVAIAGTARFSRAGSTKRKTTDTRSGVAQRRMNLPGQGGTDQVQPAKPCGQPCYFNITDDGPDYFPADGTLPEVQVIGDTAANFFWVVRGQNGESVSDNSNGAGEFDYALVPGGRGGWRDLSPSTNAADGSAAPKCSPRRPCTSTIRMASLLPLLSAANSPQLSSIT